MMMRINLLPYREENRKLRRQQFTQFAIVAVLLGAVVMVLVGLLLDMQISRQDDRNNQLKSGIAQLDVQIKEVTALQQEIANLIERKNTIESLQEDRSETIHLLSEMVNQLPSGVYLTGLTQKGKVVTLNGYTQSSTRVSTLMRNIENSRGMARPMLIRIRAVQVANRPLGAFELKFNLVKEPEAGSAGKNVAQGGQK